MNPNRKRSTETGQVHFGRYTWVVPPTQGPPKKTQAPFWAPNHLVEHLKGAGQVPRAQQHPLGPRL
jgi:hypothetical protein